MKKWVLAILAIWTAYGCIGCGQKEKGAIVIKSNTVQEETGEKETESGGKRDETDIGKEMETLYGNVESIGEGEFVLDKAEVEDNVMVSSLIDKTLIPVKYTEQTRWIVKKIKNMGIDTETDVTSFEGGEENLEIKQSVEIQGSYDEDIFAANVIEISIFEE